jgi:hypothetical protein
VLATSRKLQSTAGARPAPSLHLKGNEKDKGNTAVDSSANALVEAARTSTAQLIPRRNFSLLASDDLALYLSLLPDPGTDHVARFSMPSSRAPSFTLGDPRVQSQTGGGDALLRAALASVVRAVLDLGLTVRAQTHVFLIAERRAL